MSNRPERNRCRSNRYALVPSTARYLDSLRSRHGGALDEAKLRQAEATAHKLEMSNRLAAGELLDAAEVKREWLRLVMDLRSAILAAAPRVAAAAGLDRNATAKLDEELRLALTMIAADGGRDDSDLM